MAKKSTAHPTTRATFVEYHVPAAERAAHDGDENAVALVVRTHDDGTADLRVFSASDAVNQHPALKTRVALGPEPGQYSQLV